MNKSYNRFKIDNTLSMGENGFLYYNDIIKKESFNRIIISSIFNLYKKNCIQVDTNKKNELIIKVLSIKENLKKSEYFIYECLKKIDKDENGTITLNEFNVQENKVFAKNKKNIKELIFNEAIEDSLIEIDKFNLKKECFLKTIIYILYILPIVFFPKNYIIILVLLMVLINETKKIIPKNELRKLKDKLIDSNTIKNPTNNKYDILLLIVFGIIISIVNYLIFNKMYYLLANVLLILMAEALIFLFLIIRNYYKFIKINIFTNKAISIKQDLVGLSNFLKDYSLIENRKSIEINLWDNYLIFSVLFNINNTIPKELKIEFFDKSKNLKTEKQFDYYENKFFYINEKNEKIYLE